MSTSRFRVTAKAIILNQDRSRFLSLLDKHIWNFPGGGIEPGEQPLETLKREVAEEIGVDDLVIDERPLGAVCFEGIPGSRAGEPFIEIYYLARLGTKEPVLLEDKLAEMRWLTSKELYELDHGDFSPWFDKLSVFIRETTGL